MELRGSKFELKSVSDEMRRMIFTPQAGAKVMLDCCQSVPNMPMNVNLLGADWIVASSHKMCGPTGIGFLWGR